MQNAIRILEKILFDATGDMEHPDKRLWPLRVANYREASAVVSNYSASEQADSVEAKCRCKRCGLTAYDHNIDGRCGGFIF